MGQPKKAGLSSLPFSRWVVQSEDLTLGGWSFRLALRHLRLNQPSTAVNRAKSGVRFRRLRCRRVPFGTIAINRLPDLRACSLLQEANPKIERSERNG